VRKIKKKRELEYDSETQSSGRGAGRIRAFPHVESSEKDTERSGRQRYVTYTEKKAKTKTIKTDFSKGGKKKRREKMNCDRGKKGAFRA